MRKVEEVMREEEDKKEVREVPKEDKEMRRRST